MNGDPERRDRSRTPSPLSRSSSRSSIGQSPARTTLLKRNQSLSAKQIRFYRNGDKYFPGLKLAVSSERYKEFFALLVELSNKLDLKTGAVRFIFDAETGRQITDVSQLSTNSTYVCSSSSTFKELDGGYGQTQPKNWSTGSTRDRRELTNWDKSTPRMDSKREFIKPKLVTVVKNGKPPQKKVTMLLNKKTALDLNQVLDHLSSKGTLGKVDRLCCLDGREIKELRDLFEEDMIFIAFSSSERFPDEGFDVDVQSPKFSWNTSIRPSRAPYTPSLKQTELDYQWKELPRARCLACALKALTAANTPPQPQSRRGPRPKSAPPRLSKPRPKTRKSNSRPSTSSSRRSLQPEVSRSPRVSPIRCKEGPSSGSKSSSKKEPRVRSSFPKMSAPKSSTSVVKSLSFSPDTKDEEVDSPPKPKGIRGGGRRRKAQLALLNGEELSSNDPRHAYYVLIHEDGKSGKPTASVKPIMSTEEDDANAERNPNTGQEAATVEEVVVNGEPDDVVVSQEVKIVKKVTYVINDADNAAAPENSILDSEKQNGAKVAFSEIKVAEIVAGEGKSIENVVPEEKPSVSAKNNTNSPPNEEKPADRDWSKPKAIRGRRKKPKSDLNGNEPVKPEEKPENPIEREGTANGIGELTQKKLVIANGYRITPYRELKRSSAGVKRTSSLRTPRPRRNTLESNNSGGGSRGRSASPSTRSNGQIHSTPRSKLNAARKANTGGQNTSGEELYPATVFQRENSDNAKKRKKARNPKSVAKRVPTKKNRTPVNTEKFYSTVWLSDYESWDMKSETGDPSTCVSSRATTPYSSRPTTPFDSKVSSPFSSPPSSPFVARETYDDVYGLSQKSSEIDHDIMQKPKAVKLTRTLSLPESELSQIEANDLQQRFTTLQLEQENRELKQLTDDLQGALENLEKRVHSVSMSESEYPHNEKTSDGRTPPCSSDDVFGNDRALPRRAMSEPSSPSSISSTESVHNPKLSKPNSLDLSGSAARKRKHTEKLNSSRIKARKTAKNKEESICCITS